MIRIDITQIRRDPDRDVGDYLCELYITRRDGRGSSPHGTHDRWEVEVLNHHRPDGWAKLARTAITTLEQATR